MSAVYSMWEQGKLSVPVLLVWAATRSTDKKLQAAQVPEQWKVFLVHEISESQILQLLLVILYCYFSFR